MPGEHPALWRQGLSTVGIILVFVSWAITFLLPADPLSNDFGSPATNIIRLLLFAAVVLCWASRAGIIPKRMYLLVLVAVLINSGLGSIAVSLSLPFYFDALGTMFISVIAGASMGTSTALLTALLTGMFVPTNMAYAPIGVLIAYLTAAAARARVLGNMGRILLTGLFVGVCSGIVSVYSTTLSLSGDANSGVHALIEFLDLMVQNRQLALIIQALLSDPLDKIFALLIVCLAIRYGPSALRVLITYEGNRDQLAGIFYDTRR